MSDREKFEAYIKSAAWYRVLSEAAKDDDEGASVFRMARMAAREAWNAAHAQPLEAQADARWQPIETAPKDGKIWAFNGEQARMIWSEGEQWALWIWADELLSEVDPSPDQPTHWMELPKPPEPPKPVEPEPERDTRTIDMFASQP